MARINPKDNKKIFTDDILNVLPSNKNIKRGVSNQLRSEDPAFREKIKKSMLQQWDKDQSKRSSNVSKGVKKLWQDPNYVQLQKESRAEIYADPTKCGNYKGPVIGTCKKTGKTIELNGVRELRDAGFEPGNVYSCLTGHRKSTGGYTWKRK